MSSTTSTTIIDDQDLSQVTYIGSWIKGGTSHENAGTVASSTVVGDSFTVSFNGTNIGVYGTLDSTSQGVVASYSVDGAAAAQVTSPAATGDIYHQLFWQSDTLAPKQHNLVVKLVKVNTNDGPGEGTIWFDYFQVAGAVPPVSSSISSSAGHTSASVGSTASGGAAAATTSTQPDGVAHNKSNIGPIVGGIVAGTAVLILAVLLIFCLLRRRRRKAGDDDMFIPPKKEIDGAASRISPAAYMPLPQGNSRVNIPPSAPIIPPANNYPRANNYPQTNNYPQASNYPANNYTHQAPSSHASSSYNMPPTGQSVLYYNNQPQGSQYAPSSHSVLPEASSASATIPSRPSISKDGKSTNPSLTLAWVPEPVQHVDSGLRVVNPQSDVAPAEIPPVYSEH